MTRDLLLRRESSASPHNPLLCPDDLSLATRLGPGGQCAACQQPRLERAAGCGPLTSHWCLRLAFLATHSSTSFSAAFLLWSFGRWVLTTLSAARPHLSPKRHCNEQRPPMGHPNHPWSLSHRPGPSSFPCRLSCSPRAANITSGLHFPGTGCALPSWGHVGR